jgi:hypothetical protein
MIKKLLKVRRDALAKSEKSDKEEDYVVYVTLVRDDQFLELVATWYVGSLFLLAVAIFTASLSAFGGFILFFAACSIFCWPRLRNYIERYSVYSDT